MNQNQITKPLVILRPAQVAAKKGIPRSTQHVLLRAGDFPRPIKLSGLRSIGFVESEIDDWLGKRMAARDLAVPAAASDAEDTKQSPTVPQPVEPAIEPNQAEASTEGCK